MTIAEAKKIIKSECYIADLLDLDRTQTVNIALDTVLTAAEEKPQRAKGHWIEEEMFDGELGYRCSKCSELFWLESGTPKDNEYNFCPKCGARMEKVEE